MMSPQPHIALVVRNYLLEVGIDTIDWLAQLKDHSNELIQPNNLKDVVCLIEIRDGLNQNVIRRPF